MYKIHEEKAYEAEMKRIEVKNQQILRKRAIRAERKKYRPKMKWPSQSKLGMWYIFLSCTAVQIYSMAAMWHFADLSPLVTLIGATVGEAISYCAYAAKSTKENTSGGIIYDLAMRQPTDSEMDTEASNKDQEGPQG